MQKKKKKKKTSRPPLIFFNSSVKQVPFQKHLGFYLDGKLDFRKHLQNVFKKVNKTVNLLSKLQSNLPETPPVAIYRPFIRPHLNYGDI